MSYSKQEVVDFVGELTFSNNLISTLREINSSPPHPRFFDEQLGSAVGAMTTCEVVGIDL